jgi:hypothetical protein
VSSPIIPIEVFKEMLDFAWGPAGRERAAIVAWIRAEAETFENPDIALTIADSVESGEHLKAGE